MWYSFSKRMFKICSPNTITPDYNLFISYFKLLKITFNEINDKEIIFENIT